MSDIGFFVFFYLLPMLLAAGVTWAEGRTHGTPLKAGLLFSVLPVINLVYAGGWLLLALCWPVDARMRRQFDRAA